jgi:uncharacterized membrane protein YeiH
LSEIQLGFIGFIVVKASAKVTKTIEGVGGGILRDLTANLVLGDQAILLSAIR